jgi:hypothetical protein
MSKFRVGQKVRCIDDTSTSGRLQVGSYYEISAVDRVGDVTLKDLPYTYFANRFESVPPESPLMPGYEWPCPIKDATEFYKNGEWITSAIKTDATELSYNHRRKLEPPKPEPKYRPVCEADVGREVEWGDSHHNVVLVTFGEEYSAVYDVINANHRAVITKALRTPTRLGWRLATKDDIGKPVHFTDDEAPTGDAKCNGLLLDVSSDGAECLNEWFELAYVRCVLPNA